MKIHMKSWKNHAVFIALALYITSKLLWDTVPFLFEGLFCLVIAQYAFEFCGNCLFKKKNSLLIIFTAVLWVYILLDAALHDTAGEFVRCIYEYIFYMLCMFAMMRIYPKIDGIRCFKVLSVWGAFISALTWVEYLSKKYILTDLSGHGIILHVGDLGFRATVFSRSFLSHAVVLGIFSAVGVYLWYRTRQKRWLVSGGFAYISILATGSRGPLVAFAFAFIFWYWADAYYVTNRISKKVKFVLAGSLGAIALILFFTADIGLPDSRIGYFLYRIRSIANWRGDAGNVGRLRIWEIAINDWFLESPLIGIGPSKTGSWGPATLGVTESGVLKRLCELGIIGAAGFYLYVFYLLKGVLKNTKQSPVALKKDVVFWLAIFIGTFVNDITVQCTEEIMVAFWYWCALGAVFYLKKQGANGASRNFEGVR